MFETKKVLAGVVSAMAMTVLVAACGSADRSEKAEAFRITYGADANGKAAKTPTTVDAIATPVTVFPRPTKVFTPRFVPIQEDPPLGCVCSPPVDSDPTCTCNGEINCCIGCCASN
jgi:hypothetical protein